MKSNSSAKPVYTHYVKAYLSEIANEDNPEDVVSTTKIVFSKRPMLPSQFTPLVMGILEGYAEQLLTTNDPEAVYSHFNNAFGIFLSKLLPKERIYEISESHKHYKEAVDRILSQPEDAKSTEDNRIAAYILARDILLEAGLSEATVDILLNKKMGLKMPKFDFQKESVTKNVNEENTDTEKN